MSILTSQFVPHFTSPLSVTTLVFHKYILTFLFFLVFRRKTYLCLRTQSFAFTAPWVVFFLIFMWLFSSLWLALIFHVTFLLRLFLNIPATVASLALQPLACPPSYILFSSQFLSLTYIASHTYWSTFLHWNLSSMRPCLRVQHLILCTKEEYQNQSSNKGGQSWSVTLVKLYILALSLVFKFYLFIYSFSFGCSVSSLLCMNFL